MMQLKIVATNREVYRSTAVNELYAPTSSGTVGILPGYTNYLATLDVGELRVREGNEWKQFVINGGFIEVVDDQVLVLADDAAPASELLKEEISAAIKNAEQKLTGKLEPAELIRLEKLLRYEKFKSRYVGI